jgi:hypothetical protein
MKKKKNTKKKRRYNQTHLLNFELVTKGFQLPWVLLLHKNIFFQRGSLCQVQLVLLLLRFTTIVLVCEYQLK